MNRRSVPSTIADCRFSLKGGKGAGCLFDGFKGNFRKQKQAEALGRRSRANLEISPSKHGYDIGRLSRLSLEFQPKNLVNAYGCVLKRGLLDATLFYLQCLLYGGGHLGMISAPNLTSRSHSPNGIPRAARLLHGFGGPCSVRDETNEDALLAFFVSDRQQFTASFCL